MLFLCQIVKIKFQNKSRSFSTRCSKWTLSKKHVLATGIVQYLLPSVPIWEFARKLRNTVADQDIRTGDRYLTFSWQQRPSKIFVCLTISAPVLVPLVRLNAKYKVACCWQTFIFISWLSISMSKQVIFLLGKKTKLSFDAFALHQIWVNMVKMKVNAR